jgi:hypothetical protein
VQGQFKRLQTCLQILQEGLCLMLELKAESGRR